MSLDCSDRKYSADSQRVMLSIFATPSVILHASGSVGFSLALWIFGAIFAMAGSAVYVELGTVRITLLKLH